MREAIWHLSQISALPEPIFHWIEGEDWAESWKSHFHPMAAGRTLMIVPAWMEAEDPARRALFLEPGMAFGTGAHPSTRLCLEALEGLIRPGDIVVDIGCGSGILSVAALFFGAVRVLACDLDDQAIAATLRSAELNNVRDGLEVFHGSVPEMAARLADGPSADVLVANILAPVLIEMLAGGLSDLVRPGGRIVLAGILSGQGEDVDRAAGEAGLHRESRAAEGDWIALTFQKPPQGNAS
jgi:ribosomal protein L11 methyltransferase